MKGTEAHDVPHLARQLAAGLPAAVAERLCEPGRTDPAGFRAELQAALPVMGQPPTKSEPGKATDLYADLVERWGQRGVPAAWFPAEGRRLSREALHLRATALASLWREAGAAPGQGVALVLPVGEPLLVALLAAFQLGLVASFVPPRGGLFVRRALEVLQPDAVASHPRYGAWLGPWAERLLPAEGLGGSVAGSQGARSHAYAPGQPALKVLSVFSEPAFSPVLLPAEEVLWGAARDALLVYGLQPGDRLALPGFDALQWQPSALLSALFAGAEWLEVDVPSLGTEQGREQFRPTVTGVTAGLRHLWSEGPPSFPGLRRWVKNPLEPYDWSAWDGFARRLSEHGGARGINVVGSAAAGGVQLFSVPPREGTDLGLFPVPGQPYLLEDFLGNAQPAVGNTGVYWPLGGVPAGAMGRCVLVRASQGSTFGGCMEVPWHGQRYPVEWVEAAARGVKGIRDAAVWIQSSSELLNAGQVRLLCFMDATARGADAGALAREVEREVTAQCGPSATPTTVRAYPLSPRRLPDGHVDATWCRWQAQSGALDARAQDGLYRELTLGRQWAERLVSAHAAEPG